VAGISGTFIGLVLGGLPAPISRRMVILAMVGVTHGIQPHGSDTALGRGGLMFMMIIWLPLHGYSFESTPLWAGIHLIAEPFRAGLHIAFAFAIAACLIGRPPARPGAAAM
jgi:hypothetical protein